MAIKPSLGERASANFFWACGSEVTMQQLEGAILQFHDGEVGVKRG